MTEAGKITAFKALLLMPSPAISSPPLEGLTVSQDSTTSWREHVSQQSALSVIFFLNCTTHVSHNYEVVILLSFIKRVTSFPTEPLSLRRRIGHWVRGRGTTHQLKSCYFKLEEAFIKINN